VGHESPYPRGPIPDFVPYREFEALVRRFERLEARSLGESITRLEERQQAQGLQLAKLEVLVASIDANVEALQKAETQRLGFRLGTKGVIAVAAAIVGILGGIIGAVLALAGLGG
jgi:hypothetical protein